MNDSLRSIYRILDTDLINHKLKWCFVGDRKIPFQYNGEILHLNNFDEFVDIELLAKSEKINSFLGVGISVNASNITAIDIDKCFSIPFNIESGDERIYKILDLFKDYYCEFSFSGTGIRILLKTEIEKDFKNDYYIKNSKNGIEVYLPQYSKRYVTITGRYLFNNKIKNAPNSLMTLFLDLYMKREKKEVNELSEEILDEKEIKRRLKKLFIKNSRFLEVWTSKAPGSGKNESELDYYLLINLLENVTSNPLIVKQIFETSDYYLSKDKKHRKKWDETNYALATIESIKGE